MPDLRGLYALIKNGPPSESSTLIWVIGHMVWWRVLGIGFLAVVGMYASVLAYALVGELGVVVAFALGTVIGNWMIRVSPKYEVRQKY